MRLHPQHARRWAALGGVVALLAAVPAGTACELSECNPMKDRAAESMIAAWCDRYVACDASRGKVEERRQLESLKNARIWLRSRAERSGVGSIDGRLPSATASSSS